MLTTLLVALRSRKPKDSSVSLVSNIQTLAGHAIGTKHYLHFTTVQKTNYLSRVFVRE